MAVTADNCEYKKMPSSINAHVMFSDHVTFCTCVITLLVKKIYSLWGYALSYY